MTQKTVGGYYTHPAASAKTAGLNYINDQVPGIKRIKKGISFQYLGPDGNFIKDAKTLIRIKSLTIPPAWTNVWISPYTDSHLQATGMDARQRKQYKYHPSWNSFRAKSKYDRMINFGEKLPLIRKQVKKDLKIKLQSREKILAIIVALLDKTLLRVGNTEYEKSNKTYGLSSLRDKHVKFRKDEIQFKFRAKSGKESILNLKDKLLAKLVKKCHDLPGHHLFSYITKQGIKKEINSRDVNDYLKKISGEDFTAKDFRTWGGTLCALITLINSFKLKRKMAAKKAINNCINIVAQKLKNTVNICKKYYIHPKVISCYEKGTIKKFIRRNLEASELHEEKILIEILKT